MEQLRSACLSKKHDSIYSKFFYTSDIVLSVPFALQLLPKSFSENFWIHMIKKIPSRLYLWVSRSSWSWNVTFWGMSTYDREEDDFWLDGNDVLSLSKVRSIEEIFSNCLREFNIHESRELNLLSEQGKWYWFEYISMICTLFASVIVLYSESSDSSNLDKDDKWKIYDLLSRLFDDIWCCRSELLPKTIIEDGYDIQLEILLSSNLSGSEKIYSTFTNLTQYNCCLDVFDYWILSFWSWCNDLSFSLHDSNMCDEAQAILWYINDKLSRIGVVYDSSNETSFLEKRKFIWWMSIVRNLEIMSKDPHKETLAKKVLNDFWKVWMLQCFEDFNYKLLFEIYFLFDSIKLSDKEKIWIVPISFEWWWGTFFFIILKNRSRKTIKTLKDTLCKNWNINVHTSFESWRDWNVYEWLKVEQYISKWIFSKYVWKTSVFLEKNWTKSIYQHDMWIMRDRENVLLDTIHKKVFYQWSKLTYKDLRSQSSTVEIVSKLIKHNQGLIHNSEFPPSSYSKNKNEMVWKIINPLKIFMKELWFEIIIECEWSLYDFYVSLKKWSENFTVLTNVFDVCV